MRSWALMELIYKIAYGLFIGILAKSISPMEDKGGLVLTSLLGVAGTYLAFSFLGLIGLEKKAGLDLVSILISIIGCCCLLALYSFIKKFLTKK